MQGALSGALFGAAGHAGGFGEAGASTWERYAAHAGAGCVSSVAGGGNCGQGAVSAVFGKYTSNTINGWGGDNIQGIIARGVATSVAGGVGSVIAGGKFANGAETAAYGYLFNQAMQRLGCTAANFMSCAMGDRESAEWKASDQKLKAGLANVADATDKGATAAAMGCVAAGNVPCASAATSVAVVAKGVSYALNPPGPREFFLDTTSMVSGPIVDRILAISIPVWFSIQSGVTLGGEFAKPFVKAADSASGNN